MKLIFIYGYPGVGKLTLAKELEKITNYKLFHNHLTVDFVSSIFDFGTEPFTTLREKLWIDVFGVSSKFNIPGLIFTFSFEKTVSKEFIGNIKKVLKANDELHFVKIICDIPELQRRVGQPSRKMYGKLSSSKRLAELIKNETYFVPELGEDILTIDNTDLDPNEVAALIKESFSLY